MKSTIIFLTFVFFAVFLTGPSLAQELIIYPAKGQSQDQMEKDKYECYQWAKQQTGFDPMQPPQTSTPPPQQEPKKGGVGRGAARGAAVGAVAGGIAKDDAGKGAKTGAATGAVVGGIRRRDQKRQQQQAQEQWAQQEAAKYAQNRDGYNRALSACLEGKGYTVK